MSETAEKILDEMQQLLPKSASLRIRRRKIRATSTHGEVRYVGRVDLGPVTVNLEFQVVRVVGGYRIKEAYLYNADIPDDDEDTFIEIQE